MAAIKSNNPEASIEYILDVFYQEYCDSLERLEDSVKNGKFIVVEEGEFIDLEDDSFVNLDSFSLDKILSNDHILGSYSKIKMIVLDNNNNDSIVFDNSIIDTSDTLWTILDTFISSRTRELLRYTYITKYYISEDSSEIDTATIEINNAIVSTMDYFNLSNLNFYPNPTNGYLGYDYSGVNFSSVEVKIYNTQGKVKKNLELKESNGVIDLSTFGNGM